MSTLAKPSPRSRGLLLILFFFSSSLAYAQIEDYSSFPRQDADFLHLDLSLAVNQQLVVGGEATYRVRLKRSGVDSLQLDATGLDLAQVEWDGAEVAYHVRDGQLVIQIPEVTDESDEGSLFLSWQGEPRFGLHRNENGTIWSSLLPGSQQHWFPLFDHPRNRFTADLTLYYPAGRTAVTGGLSADTEVESVDMQSASWSFSSPVPATSIAFAIGRFNSWSEGGRYPVEIFAEEDISDPELSERLIEVAQQSWREAEIKTGFPFPWGEIRVVMLDDDQWETRNYGAGLVFIYPSQGNLVGQVRRGVISQWFGVQSGEEMWAEAHATLLLQAWLYGRDENVEQSDKEEREPNTLLRSEPAMYTSYWNERMAGTLYDQFSIQQLEKWSEWLNSENGEDWRFSLDRVAPGWPADRAGVITWNEMAEKVYEETGLPLLDSPEPYISDDEVGEPEPLIYRVLYDLDEMEGSLSLQFIAEGRATDELIGLTVELISDGEVLEREIAFTGASDSMVLNVPSTLNRVLIRPDSEQQTALVFKEEKPFHLWIEQLRESSDAEDRRVAAIGLTDYSDNPDLQLALLDILDSEENPDVYAALVRTLSEVTDGASGTDQIYLQRFRTDLDLQVQSAFIQAFGDYENLEAVIAILESVVRGSAPIHLRREAIRSLSMISSPDRFLRFSESVVHDGQQGQTVSDLLVHLARKGEAEAAVALAEPLLSRDNNFSIRSAAFEFLLNFDHDLESWEQRTPPLLEDRDPRIRYLAVESLLHFDPERRRQIAEERLFEEFDFRVRHLLEVAAQ
ncbi:MAG: hypothetical protein WD529_00290 [Balneolaceae bacterium]